MGQSHKSQKPRNICQAFKKTPTSQRSVSPVPVPAPPPSIPQLVLSHRRLLGEKRRKAQRVKMGKRDMGESERER